MEQRDWLTVGDTEQLLDSQLYCGCGSDMLFFTITPTGYGDYRYQVTCSHCEARGGKATNKEQALKLWQPKGG